MAGDDKAQNKGQDLGGKVKEGAGKATGNERMEAEGKGDQASASAKEAGRKVKDTVEGLKDGLTGGSKDKH